MPALQQIYSYRHAPPESSTQSIFSSLYTTNRGFPDGAVVKSSPENARDAGSIPQSGRSPWEGNGNPPLQYSCLKNPMYRGAWQATVHGVTESQTWLSMPARTHTIDVEKRGLVRWGDLITAHCLLYRTWDHMSLSPAPAICLLGESITGLLVGTLGWG